MTRLFLRPEERSFGIVIARARFLWLFVAALLLPIAASLAQNAPPATDRLPAQAQGLGVSKQGATAR